MSILRAPSRGTGSPSDATAYVSIRYEPVAEIGAGGMGTVILARATTGPSAGMHVAMKRIFRNLEKDPAVFESFLDEVWLTSALHHPNVVQPLDWGRDDEGSYLVMQFVRGDSLRALIRARERAAAPLPIEVVVEVLFRAATGLHAAHELRGEDGKPLELVHRDISPANVLVGYDGTVTLIDFGVAKAAKKIVKTESGLIKGKYAYMSPEQIQGKALDRRSDIFSLGIVAWEMLTLCRLYAAGSEFDILRMISEEEPVPPSDLRHDVPPTLDAIVLRCLAKNADERFATCADLAAALAPLRVPELDARLAIARVAREAMPERLVWIEQVTGQPVPLPDGADTASSSMPARDPSEQNIPSDTFPTLRIPPGSKITASVAAVPAPISVAPPRPSVAPSRAARAMPFVALGAIALVALIIGAWLGSH